MDTLKDELERQLTVLLAPNGDPQYVHARDEAFHWLLAHAEESHARLLDIARAAQTPIALLALARFGRAESISVLEAALHGDDPTTVIAAQALAGHPSDEARAALERALTDSRDQVVASAADGLALRADASALPALERAAGHANLEVRERISRALAELRRRERPI